MPIPTPPDTIEDVREAGKAGKRYTWTQTTFGVGSDILAMPEVPTVGMVWLTECALSGAPGPATSIQPSLGYTNPYVLGTIDEITHIAPPVAPDPLPTFVRCGCVPYAVDDPLDRTIYCMPTPNAVPGAGQILTTRITVLEP